MAAVSEMFLNLASLLAQDDRQSDRLGLLVGVILGGVVTAAALWEISRRKKK